MYVYVFPNNISTFYDPQANVFFAPLRCGLARMSVYIYHSMSQIIYAAHLGDIDFFKKIYTFLWKKCNSNG